MDSAFTRLTSCLLARSGKVRSGQCNQKPLSSELALMNGCRTYLLPMERYTFHVALSTHGNYSLPIHRCKAARNLIRILYL
jgi:hypothetical protein